MLLTLRAVLVPLSLIACAVSTVFANEVHLTKGTDAEGKPQFTLGIDPTEGFTMMIATYRRDLLLPPLLRHLTSKPPPSLRHIHIVWQNVGVDLPDFLSPRALEEWSTSGVVVSVRKSWKNSMNERFRPTLDWGEEVTTKAVMIMDDDVVLRKSSLEWAYQEFVEANKYGPGRIVGFSGREFEGPKSDGTWSYITNPTETYSMVLSNAAFLKKEWLVKYWDSSKEMESLRNYVDSVFNCDDILINFLVSNLTGTSPLLLQPATPLRTVPTEGLWNKVAPGTPSSDSSTSSSSSPSTGPDDSDPVAPPRPEHFATRKECLSHYFSHFAPFAPTASSSPSSHYPLIKSKRTISQDVSDHSRSMFENEMWETVVWTQPEGGNDDGSEDDLSPEEEALLERGDYDQFLEGLSDEEVDELMKSLEEIVDEGEGLEAVEAKEDPHHGHSHDEL